jgi:hypothetical protein
VGGSLALGALQGASPAGGAKITKKFYADDPIVAMPAPAPVKNATPRELSEYYDFFENTLFAPGERAAHHGEFLPSQAINTIDEEPDSAWYTNRHASRRMSQTELKAGPGDSKAPADGQWTVVAAKNQGITLGFRIRDAAGRQYLIKFDPPSNPELASAADVITSKFFYALGYNVPENYVVYFDRSRIAIGANAQLKDDAGHRRPIREADVDEMLAKTPRTPDGRYRALASLLIAGKPLGPWQYFGTRSDDPNDLVNHEDRRDLRALRTFCAWLGHDDSKALNSLDVLVNDGGTPYIKHYLIDFGASLGSATFMANSPRDGNVYLFDWKSSAAQFFTLGLYAPKWQHAKYPKLPAAGRFEYEIFDPTRWVPDYPNAAFRNENPGDRLWAAHKIAAFSDDDIRAIVTTGQYTDPAAAEWVARCLIERRNKIVKAYVRGTGAFDSFAVRDNRLEPAAVAGMSLPSAEVHWAEFDNKTGMRRFLPGRHSWELPRAAEQAEYLVAEIQGSEGPRISVYVKNQAGRRVVIGVERDFDAAREN